MKVQQEKPKENCTLQAAQPALTLRGKLLARFLAVVHLLQTRFGVGRKLLGAPVYTTPKEQAKSASAKLREAGFQRRPSFRSLPSDE